MTDDFDKRLLNTFCRVWFGENMFMPNFTFYKDYVNPKVNRITEFLEYINSLPSSDTPEVFGLHANADITYVTLTSTWQFILLALISDHLFATAISIGGVG